jgi:WD repeat-containing protein 23
MLPGRVLRHYLHHNDEETTMAALRRRQRRRAPPEYPKVPSEAGRELMASGDFGANPYFVDQSTKRNQKLFSRLLWREMDQGQRGMRAMAPRTISQASIF